MEGNVDQFVINVGDAATKFQIKFQRQFMPR